MKRLATASRFLSRACMALSALCLALMSAVLIWQVFARYVLQASPTWSEQLALVLMMAMASFASASGVREGFHMAMTLAVDALPPRRARWARFVSSALVGVFGALMAVTGVELAAVTWAHALPGLGLPRGAAYGPLVISGVLIVVFATEHCIAEARGARVEPQWT